MKNWDAWKIIIIFTAVAPLIYEAKTLENGKNTLTPTAVSRKHQRITATSGLDDDHVVGSSGENGQISL